MTDNSVADKVPAQPTAETPLIVGNEAAPPEQVPAQPAAQRPRIAKQAVVVIHGMGEQKPMDTIKGFVKTVWQDDQRITAFPGGVRTDFFEFYWADLTARYAMGGVHRLAQRAAFAKPANERTKKCPARVDSALDFYAGFHRPRLDRACPG